mmetsp:Transcript_32514/g.60734  ORF Transcript_32514/g.60734 Transcript_32514/m.60734 type:complete len:433 (-) Transcript_32514:278-1576(-)|eukprot:CAMPEP_0114430782 /NCGR_PEP_ID=MMETSP0103-20121206/10228_1 /TAXON_ID=37642 ORGANISM="Paraphysomonas imperforata, Strain PA2" /NCGR_SAMPLE_ID=MMETSP0103 /ASSEMBLY_ACC=CAM_ASM_000201 /LENGTH=432 /DNA_ID=CAMNT_0001600259 /DNA_START=71 /DNA_END=1369 /DNA_ORIENTATION=+
MTNFSGNDSAKSVVIDTISSCRICGSEMLEDVIDLGTQRITSRWPVYGDFSTPCTPISLCACQQCNLLQLRQTTFASELYEHDYGYRSGISNTMRSHLLKYQEEIVSKVTLNDNDIVVDIGSNDSTMLQHYDSRLRRVGIDPTGSQFSQYYGDVQLLPTYFNEKAFVHAFPGGQKAKVVSSISMFYDLPDPVQFARDIEAVLADDGIWTCEQSYMPMMVDTNSVDTICHEHLEYYGLKQIKLIADKANLKIVDLQFNSCNGGSSRLYFAKRNSPLVARNADLLEKVLLTEEDYYKDGNDYYRNFMHNCDIEVNKLREFVKAETAQGKTINIYGASTKGNCTLQYAGLGEDLIPFAVERNPDKAGKMTATGIPIIMEEDMRRAPPDYLLVLPWHFRAEILEREKEYRNNGGKMIFPFPHFEVVGADQDTESNL